MSRAKRKAVVDGVRQVSASAFKATCLELMDEIARTGRELVVTKRGVPVVRVSAASAHADSPWGFLAGTIVRHGDIVTPDDAAWAPSVTDPLHRGARR